ncbi:hypothetical protein WN51_08926 [Melipona quadrifasciata]|uniref:Uncharacterized protein n=1 Tax=Melipona quadrifasciata TaxID=166423 RepID=A0A0N0BBN8_9HYME|nr:hypothetical protein WN51_08926 [Melipona quadrifasciata]
MALAAIGSRVPINELMAGSYQTSVKEATAARIEQLTELENLFHYLKEHRSLQGYEGEKSARGSNPESRASSGATLMQRKLAIGRFGHVIREEACGRPRVGVALSGTEQSRFREILIFDASRQTILSSLLI